MESLKGNKEVDTSCFELGIPKKKLRKYLESFSISFQNKYLDLDSTISFLMETNLFLETVLFHPEILHKITVSQDG